jgi:hypothetical protein
MKTSILFLISFLLFNKENKPQAEQRHEKLSAIFFKANVENKFEILNVDSIENVYLIYAKRKDSVVKIVSKKEGFCDCRTIEKGKFYDLHIKSLFPENFYQKRDVAGVKFNGMMIKLEGKGVIWDLFVSENLDGLCLVNQACSNSGAF